MKVDPGGEKVFKRLRFVSETIFSQMVRGADLTFEPENCINGKLVWVTRQERTRLAPWSDDASGDIVMWKTAVVPRVTLDRISSASAIWHFGETFFAGNTGLWFAVHFSSEQGVLLREQFEACLHLLGDMGLGGERCAGHGLFTVGSARELIAQYLSGADHFITLAPLCPRSAAEAAQLTTEGAAYELLTRRGWVTSPEGSHLHRKTLRMFAEGFLLAGTGRAYPGCLADVTPEAFTGHRVFRYGFGFPVGAEPSCRLQDTV